MKKKVLITAALPYVNYVQHFGHMVGCHLPADVFFRFNRSFGNDAIFIGGSDDHGTATLISAKEAGLEPKTFVKRMGDISREIYKKLGISYSFNSGTCTDVHSEVTQEFFRKLEENGLIEERDSEMLYCEKDNIALADRFVLGTCPYCGYESAYGDQCDACGKSYDTNEILSPKCKFCGDNAVRKSTKHLYLKLDSISSNLNEWVESKKSVWRPHVYGEAKKWINEGLLARAITRDISWGIKVLKEGYENKVFYVWFDAPIGYISITKEWGGEQMVKDFWENPDCEIYNFIGKDNISFHSVFFPSMIIGNGKYQLAHNVVGFNFMNYEGGQKFSKSKKVGVFCDGILDSDIDIDVLRAYLVTVFPENKDSDFKWEGFKQNTNSEIVGKFGNFFNRTLNMTHKNFEGKLNFEITDETVLSDDDKAVLQAIKDYPQKIADLFLATEFREAYKEIMNFASVGNQYMEKTAPWSLMKEGKEDEVRKVLYICLCLAKSLAIVASPIMPNKTKEIWQEQLNFDGDPTADDMWEKASEIDVSKNHQINVPKPLFQRIDDARLEELKLQFSKVLDIEKLIKE